MTLKAASKAINHLFSKCCLVLPLNPAGLAGSATKGPAQLWTPGLPSSAVRLFLLNPFLPHPFTNPNAITIPFPPIHLDQLNSSAVEFPAAAEGQCPNFHPFLLGSSFPIAKHLHEDQPVAFPSFLELLPALCPPGFHLIQLGWITRFGLISLPFCSCQAWRQLWKHIPRAEEV